MRIRIMNKNAHLDDSLRDYINKRILKFNTFASNIINARVILEEERFSKVTEIIVDMKKTRFVAKHSSPDFYASIDNAAQGLTRQLRRYMDKIKARRRRFAVARAKRRFREAFEL